jgi:hypothetical protein
MAWVAASSAGFPAAWVYMVISFGPSVVDEELPLPQPARVAVRAAAAMLVARIFVNFLFMGQSFCLDRVIDGVLLGTRPLQRLRSLFPGKVSGLYLVLYSPGSVFRWSDGIPLYKRAGHLPVHPWCVGVLEFVEEFQDSPPAHLVVGEGHRGQARPEAVCDEFEVVDADN